MKSRRKVVQFVEEQLGSGCKTRSKPETHHYGRQELRELLDYIYGKEPANYEECIISDRGSYKTSFAACAARKLDLERVLNLQVDEKCLIVFYNGVYNALVERTLDKYNFYSRGVGTSIKSAIPVPQYILNCPTNSTKIDNILRRVYGWIK